MSLSDRRLLIRFVDGTKLRGTVNKFEGRAATRRDLERLEEWQAAAGHEPAAMQDSKKANSILGCVNRKVAGRSKKGIIPICSARLGPHVE